MVNAIDCISLVGAMSYQAIKYFPNNKIISPDGFNGEFF